MASFVPRHHCHHQQQKHHARAIISRRGKAPRSLRVLFIKLVFVASFFVFLSFFTSQQQQALQSLHHYQEEVQQLDARDHQGPNIAEWKVQDHDNDNARLTRSTTSATTNAAAAADTAIGAIDRAIIQQRDTHMHRHRSEMLVSDSIRQYQAENLTLPQNREKAIYYNNKYNNTPLTQKATGRRAVVVRRVSKNTTVLDANARRNRRRRRTSSAFLPNMMMIEEGHPELDYAPQRIPGYLYNSSRTLFGFVMRDLTTRILSRQIAESNVLVVSDDAPVVLKVLEEYKRNENVKKEEQQPDNPLPIKSEEEQLRHQINHTVGGCTLIQAYFQGHSYHGLTSQIPVDDWWLHYNETTPNWFLFMMVDAPFRSDDVIRHGEVMLKQAAVTYIVIGIGCDPDPQRKSLGQVFGMQAIEILLKLRYKVQVLSMSHGTNIRSAFRPNYDITLDNLHEFKTSMRGVAYSKQAPVRGYVFATQGLDLAIPLATEYLEKVAIDQIDYKKCHPTYTDIQIVQIDDNNSNSSDKEKVHVTCNKEIVSLLDEVGESVLWHSGRYLNESEAICARIQSCEVPAKDAGPFPDEHERSAAKVACKTRILPKGKKADQSIDNGNNGDIHEDDQSEWKGTITKNKPNLLLLMIDPISRARFERSLAKTNYLLQYLNFTSFSQYTAVGNNSGPNQAALYSGQPLTSRDGIGSLNQQDWLWDTLKEQGGYAAFKAEDGCIENSNMLQSVRPRVDHGDAFHQMMCFDFQRPNCLGGKRAAEHLLEYATDFIVQYSQRHQPWAAFVHFIDSHEDTMIMEGMLDELLWKFLFNLYGQQDCTRQTSEIPCDLWNNTMIVLLSDHGLHYGSYLTTPQGLRERSQPIFHVHLPEGATADQRQALAYNKDLYTTPFDMHETLLEFLLPDYYKKLVQDSVDTKQQVGQSLLQMLPNERSSCSTTDLIPHQTCQLILEGVSSTTPRMMPNPPSALSFYADIHRVNKVSAEQCEPEEATLIFQLDQKCMCATSHRDWYNCTAHPWSTEATLVHGRNMSSLETFSVVDCGDTVDKRKYEVQVKPDPAILNRSSVQRAKETGMNLKRPNILIIEMDSVSTAYADRHLPKTRELLRRLRIRHGQAGHDCDDDHWCSAEMRYVSVTGANSIPNQISAFGGCIVSTGPEQCYHTGKTKIGGMIRELCAEHSHQAFRMELVATHRRSQTWCRRAETKDEKIISPWIFDIAKSAGYVSLFAEEFCYDKSPYVSQGNIFEVDADIKPHLLFCRMLRKTYLRRGEDIQSKLWKFADNPLDSCVDGPGSFPKVNISLNHITTMWDAYPDTPKLAFVNAMAAHVYTQYPHMAAAAEAYDYTLSSFLDNLLQREDNTIILLRSDHGLQGPPTFVDYSTQIEALRPWTEIIVPKKQCSQKVLGTLFQNQERLVTGADLYRTLTTAIIADDKSLLTKHSNWTNDIMNKEASKLRTCADAKIESAYCLLEEQRSFTAPNLGSCNLAEDYQEFLCPPAAARFAYSLATDVRTAIKAKELDETMCPIGRSLTISNSLQAIWSEIDSTVASYEGIKVSGGIFLYPLQASMITAIIKTLADFVAAAESRTLTVCETGFGAGHSAATFLEAHPRVHLHTFDKFDRPYQLPIVEQLNTTYPSNQLNHYVGDSCEQVRNVLMPVDRPNQDDVQCDLLHGSSLCPEDNIALVERSPCGVVLTTTAMNSLIDNVVYFGPKGQWTKLAEKGCIRDITCFAEEERTLDRNFVFNQEGATISHKFCMAITTGKCQRYRKQIGLQEKACMTKLAHFTKREIYLPDFCKAYQVPVPFGSAASQSMVAETKT